MIKLFYTLSSLCISLLVVCNCHAQFRQGYNITLMNAGSVYLQQLADTILLPDESVLPFDCVNENWKLIGWTPYSKLNSSNVAPKDLLTGLFVLKSDTVLYAVYEKKPAITDIVREGQLLDRNWKFNGRFANSQFVFDLTKPHFLVSDSVNFESIDTVFVTAKRNSTKNIQIKIVASKNHEFNETEYIFDSFHYSGSINADSFKTLNCIVNKPITDGYNYIKLYPKIPQLSGTPYGKEMYIKNLSIKYKTEYTLFPTCSDVSYKITLINGDRIYKSLTHIGNEPIDLPMKDIVCQSEAAVLANWRFMGWSDKPIEHISERYPVLISPKSFLPTSDTTLYAVYRFAEYKEISLEVDTNNLILGVVTDDGLKVLPSTTKVIPYTGNDKDGATIPAESYDLTMVDFVDNHLVVPKEIFDNKTWRIYRNSTYNGSFLITKLFSMGNYCLSYYSNGSKKLLFDEKVPPKQYYWSFLSMQNSLYRIAATEYDSRGLIYSKEKNEFVSENFNRVDNVNYFAVTLMTLGKFCYSSNPYIVTSLAETDTLNITSSSGKFVTDELHLKVSKMCKPQIVYDVPLIINNSIKIDYHFDANDSVAYLSLPFDTEIDDCCLISATDTLVYGSDWYIGQCSGNIISTDSGAFFKWNRVVDRTNILERGEGFKIVLTSSLHGDVRAEFISKERGLMFDIDDFIVRNRIYQEEDSILQLCNWQQISNPYLYTFDGVVFATGEGQPVLNYVTVLSTSGEIRQLTLYDALQQGCFAPYTPIYIQLQSVNDKVVFTNNPDIVVPETIKPKLELIVSADGVSDYTTVIFDKNMTDRYEIGYDYLKFGQHDEQLSVYTVDDDLILSVNAPNIALPFSVDLGVYSDKDREVVFSINKDFDTTNGNVFLYDKLNNVCVNIVNEGYCTSISKGVVNNRFCIRINRDDVSTSINYTGISDSTFCELVDGVIDVYNLRSNTMLLVTDLSGKIIYSNYFNSGVDLHHIQLFYRGVYIVHIFNDTDRVSYKLIY